MPEAPFTPRPGQTDYTNIQRAPVVNCIVSHGGKILIVERSEGMRFYPGLWNGISGFLDDEKSVREKVKEELREELGILEENIASIREGTVFEQEAPEYEKTWIVHPVLVRVRTPGIELDSEAAEYAWIAPQDVWKYELLPGFERVFACFYGDSDSKK